jgi:hypothetical protein
MTSTPSQTPEPLPPNTLARAYKLWLRDTPAGRLERRAMKQRIMELQEKWDRKNV